MNYEKARDAVDDYSRRFRKPGLAPLAVGEVYDLFPHIQVGALSAGCGWPDAWPSASSPGVYLIFSELGELLYVGKASMKSSLAIRLSAYFKYGEDKNCFIKKKTWSATPRYVLTVGVPDDMPFEAPALEEFLISELDPSDNTAGRRYETKQVTMVLS